MRCGSAAAKGCLVSQTCMAFSTVVVPALAFGMNTIGPALDKMAPMAGPRRRGIKRAQRSAVAVSRQERGEGGCLGQPGAKHQV